MSPRTAPRAAAAMVAVFAALAATTVGLVAFAGARPDDVVVLAFSGYVGAGALVAARQPANAVGWLLGGIGLAYAFGAATEAYVSSDIGVARQAVGWLSSGSTPLWLVGAGVLLPLLFPHGRPLTPRWRSALWLAAAALICSMAGTLFKTGELDLDTEGIPNPLALSGAAGEVADALQQVGTVLLAAAVAVAATSLVLRFRRSHGTERQQLKWFAYVGGLTLGCLAGAAATAAVGAEDPPAWADAVGAVLWFSALGLIMFGLPLATGVAILRHRLYDIDLVIRRTLVYAALTATLAGGYLGTVLLAQLVIGAESDIAIAGSTLAMAALFRPARARIQAAVDRRFYRRRYDAALTLEAFGAHLRDQLDIDALGADLRGIVGETLQPAHVSLWLRRPS